MNTNFEFKQDGFEIFSFLSESEFFKLKSFGIGILQSLFRKYMNVSPTETDILNYHTWSYDKKTSHAKMLCAKNRHSKANDQIKSLLFNSILSQLLEKIGINKFDIWDEGLGWLAFRLVRPGPGDGYPFSCKNWGPAKNVFSLWIPIVGFSQKSMIHLIPGSHLKEYPRYLPKETHFTKDEFRLDADPSLEECIRPKMSPGQALLFHPKTIHAEEVGEADHTRFNLELRIVPL